MLLECCVSNEKAAVVQGEGETDLQLYFMFQMESPNIIGHNSPYNWCDGIFINNRHL